MSESHNLRPEQFPDLNEENAGYEGLLMLGYKPAEAEKILKEKATEDDMTVAIIRKMAESKDGRETLRGLWEGWVKQEVKPPFLAALTEEQIELIRSGK